MSHTNVSNDLSPFLTRVTWIQFTSFPNARNVPSLLCHKRFNIASLLDLISIPKYPGSCWQIRLLLSNQLDYTFQAVLKGLYLYLFKNNISVKGSHVAIYFDRHFDILRCLCLMILTNPRLIWLSHQFSKPLKAWIMMRMWCKSGHLYAHHTPYFSRTER